MVVEAFLVGTDVSCPFPSRGGAELLVAPWSGAVGGCAACQQLSDALLCLVSKSLFRGLFLPQVTCSLGGSVIGGSLSTVGLFSSKVAFTAESVLDAKRLHPAHSPGVKHVQGLLRAAVCAQLRPQRASLFTTESSAWTWTSRPPQ